jgi:hypothetical protein
MSITTNIMTDAVIAASETTAACAEMVEVSKIAKAE